MWSKLRELVSGKKNRYKENGFNLDLTYVCNRIIGMSFPASGIEKTYRNDIQEVALLLEQKHKSNYLIFNLSGRVYDYSHFKNKVVSYQWEDHHSPPIHILFQACEKIHSFLKENINNVVVVHCLAGKGRTGTVICCYLMYSGRFKTPEDALQYYSQKRFSTEGLGVTQPSQIRYIHYFYKLLKTPFLSPTLKLIDYVKLYGVPNFNSGNSCKPYIDIFSMADYKKIYTGKKSFVDQINFETNLNEKQQIQSFELKPEKIIPIFGDILIQVKNNGRYRNKLMFRFAFNTAFIPKDNFVTFYLNDLDPDSTINNERFPSNFIVEVKFTDMCPCSNETPFQEKCSYCLMDLDSEKYNWDIIYDIMRNYNCFKDPIAFEESKILLFGNVDLDDVELTLKIPIQIPIFFNKKEENKDEEESESNSDKEEKKNDKTNDKDEFYFITDKYEEK